MKYSVRSLKVGQVEIPGPELFWMGGWDEWYPLWLQIVLIQGNGVTALVNTGPPPDLSPINSIWTSMLGDRAELIRAPEEEIDAVLARVGLSPSDITHLFLTPLQLYTTGNVLRFPNATICLSKRGWIHYHTTHEHPHDSRWHSISKEVLVHMVTDGWDRVRLLEPEDEPISGIRSWDSGVHHRASMVVEVDSASGVVAISDSFFYYENIEEGRLLGINENMYEALAANQRVLNTAQHIIPLYEPRVFDRYPEGIVA